MKSFSILLGLVAALNVVVQGYEVKCNKYYSVGKGEDCTKISVLNEISELRLTTLNPDVDCKKLKKGTSLCVKGKINHSSDGTCGHKNGSCPFGECCSKDGVCGTSAKHCGDGCNPNYGICEDATPNVKTKVKAKGHTLKEMVKNFDDEAISDIEEHLKMNPSEATKFYKNANKAMAYFSDAFLYSVNGRLSLKKCLKKCEKADEKFTAFLKNKNNNFNLTLYNQYLESHQESTIDIDFLLNSCKSKCYMIKEIDENNTVDKEKMAIIKEKRDYSDCEPASQGKISVVNSNYKNGIPQYQQDKGSALTGINLVNGCSIPIIQNLYNGNDYGLFVPVCNSHDLCYGCRVTKDVCDTRFLGNMKDLCKIYSKWWQIADYYTCLGEAEVFYTAVSHAKSAQEAYDGCVIYNNDPNCALCGTKIIQDKLLKEPFYVKL